jgi:hypothetical protein
VTPTGNPGPTPVLIESHETPSLTRTEQIVLAATRTVCVAIAVYHGDEEEVKSSFGRLVASIKYFISGRATTKP